MRRFTTEQLRTFVAVVEHQTLEEAAVELRVTSSAVSQRIKAMEKSCGQILLRRTNPVEPTIPGEAVLRLARQVEELSAQTVRELTGEATARRVAVASNADSLATWFLEALAAVPWEARIHCEVRREDERHSSALLRAGAVMAVLTVEPHPVTGCSVERLGDMRYWVVAAPRFVEHWFPEGLGEESLAAAPILQYDRKDDQMLDDAARLLAAEHGVGPRLDAPRVYIPGSVEYWRAAEMGLGWGVVPEAQCGQSLEQGSLVRLVDRPVDAPMFWQRWSISSPALDTLTDVVRTTAHRTLLL